MNLNNFKTIEKMSTSYTSKDIVDYCINYEFSKNSIGLVREYLPTVKTLTHMHTLFSIDGDGIKLHAHNVDKDNEWKLQFFIDSLHRSLGGMELNCTFMACLNDGLPHSDIYTKFSTFGRHYKSNHIGLPDPLVCGKLTLSNALPDLLKDDIPFKNKKDSLVFRGSDTSKHRGDGLNQRISFCHTHRESSLIDAKITLYAHFNAHMLNAVGVDKDSITSYRSPSHEQLQHKFIIYMNGNTVSGDRMMWQMASNSILVQVKPRESENDYIWYHSFLNNLGILPTFNEESFIEEFEKFKSNTDLDQLNKAQQYFANQICDFSFQKSYIRESFSRYEKLYHGDLS